LNLKDRQNYSSAGIDIETAESIKKTIGRYAKTTFNNRTRTFGSFGSMFELAGFDNPILVSSTDGVGTKLKIASLLNRYDTVGMDIVNHCVNDILCNGAMPLFFLDYIAMDKLITEQIEGIISGIARACREVGCSLIGGETAEMPGIYLKQTYDLVGFIVGVVEKGNIINGSAIKAGDLILGLPSSGLHTNGYSLVRKVFKVEDNPSLLYNFSSELGRSLGEELLQVHHCYYSELKPVLSLINGLAHITGGGFEGNINRILPKGTAVHIRKGAWQVPPIFNLIQRQGNVEEAEMYRVFNMGIGMTIVCLPQQVDNITNSLPQVKVIGEVIKAKGTKTVFIN
jgi:phosphoribosylformylglycinamidine cyclo-ligase